MKETTDELRDYLHNADSFHVCDLYELKLANGTTAYYADYDRPVTAGGRVYVCDGPRFTRDGIKLSAGITVDKMSVTIDLDATDKVGDVPLIQLAHNGGLDNATLTLKRAFMSEPGKIVGTLTFFGGAIEIKDGGGLSLAVEVKSAVQKLNVDYPVRKYYPTCPYVLYGAMCGLKKSDWGRNATVTGVHGDRDFQTGVAMTANYYAQGALEWTGGANAGAVSSVKLNYADGRVVLLVPTDAPIRIGDAFTIYPGCNKTVATCRDKFANLSRNRATPFIPLKETLV